MQKPKGTYDVLPSESSKWQDLENIIRSICSYYNYKEIRTPLFERSEVFHRTSGEGSDIVRKETYDFKDRGNRSMTLRPEGTAGVVRAFVENKLYANVIQPTKVFYMAPMFRYEQPQSGRFRQHTQFGVEVFGADSPIIDAEVISIACRLFELIGIDDLVVKINSLGDEESRANYRQALVDYLQPQREHLCKDCQERIDTNPLRVLDCKVDSFDNPPLMSDYRTDEAKNYFEEVCTYLDALGIKVEVDDTLVRGLDYYNHTVFEVQATIEGFGSQNTLCGGGRYNKMVSQFGGPQVSSIGFGMGLERVLLAMEATGVRQPAEDFINVYVVTVPETKFEGVRLVDALRMNGFIAEMDYEGKSFKAQFKSAGRYKAEAVIIMGDEEYEAGEVSVKHDGNQDRVKFENIIDYLDGLNLGDKHE